MASDRPKRRSKRYKYNNEDEANDFLVGLNEKDREAYLSLKELEDEEREAGDGDFKFDEDEESYDSEEEEKRKVIKKGQ